MQVIINSDIGEGTGNDEELLPYIQAANIACGYHAGDAATMHETVQSCIRHQVSVGAHPSFFDRENFGRKEMDLPPQEIYELVTQQLLVLNEVALSCGTRMNHVKPHGALYNLSARDPLTALMIARAILDFDAELILFGLSGSHSITAAEKLGLQTASEVFADRSYQADGSLTPRTEPGALITATEQAVEQALQMTREGTVTTLTGIRIPIRAETICIHGDGIHAVEFAKAIREALTRS